MIRTQLESRGVRQPAVLDALLQIPREWFVPEELQNNAYEDRALPIECGQTISQPYIVAYMSEQLQLAPEHRVLEIGTGSGYQTAILACLARQVYSMDAQADLSSLAQQRLRKLHLPNIFFAVGDGSCGWEEHAPFDRIIVTAAAPRIPAPLLAQLANSGRMIIPVGGWEEQQLILVEKQSQACREIPLIGCRFVKLIGQYGWPPAHRS
ncbi:MAG: Protein-L-isoaspartate O-methyltransferase [Phycisphaerae bacterium]|nr:Protein-L-isoaspartate O-methyltransferase [Phycisphaerae bacterium]